MSVAADREHELLKGLPLEEQKRIREQAQAMMKDKLSAMEQVFACAEKGDLAGLVDHLVAKKDFPDVNARDDQGRTLLHLACFSGKLDCVKFLLEDCKADARVSDSNKRTLLHVAAFGNHVKIAELLILKGANVNALDSTGSSPLHWANKKGNSEVAVVLIERGAELDRQTEEGERIGRTCFSLCFVLSCPRQGWTPLTLACEGSHTDVAKLMVCRGANINIVDKQGVSPLRVAVNTGNVELANFFLERNAEGINDKVKDTHLIDLACARKYYDLVELLIKHGARVTERILKMALKDSNLRLLRLCVGQKMELPQTALYLACKKGDFDLARVMIDDLHMVPDLSCVKYARESRESKFEAWIRERAADELAKKCLGCGKAESAELKLLRCGKCKMVKFCSVACQKAEQKAHAPFCAPPPEKQSENTKL